MRVRSDNSTVVACLNAGYSAAENLRPVLKRILQWCFRNKVILQAEHIPEVQNGLADSLNRVINKDDWALNREVAAIIIDKWGLVDIDRMASVWPTVVPKYNALY